MFKQLTTDNNLVEFAVFSTFTGQGR